MIFRPRNLLEPTVTVTVQTPALLAPTSRSQASKQIHYSPKRKNIVVETVDLRELGIACDITPSFKAMSGTDRYDSFSIKF